MENPLLSPVAEVSELDASSIVTIRYVDVSGFECQLSLEARTGVEALNKVQLAIEKLKELRCVPVTHCNSDIPTNNPKEEDAHTCPIHNVPMKMWQKGGRTWYSHNIGSHWCKGGQK